MFRRSVPFTGIGRIVSSLTLGSADQLFCHLGQMRLLFRAKAVGVIRSEICRSAEKVVHKAGHNRPQSCYPHVHALFIGEAMELRILRFLSKMVQLGFPGSKVF